MRHLFSEEEIAFRKSVESFVAKEILPIAAEIDERETYPIDIFRRIGELGYLGIRYPEEYGGSGGSFTLFLIMVEELARGSLGIATNIAMQSLMSTNFVHRFASEDHKRRLLVPAIMGEKIGAFCLSEPNAGSDLSRIETIVTDDGDCWRLNGRKMWVTSGTLADFFTVAATRDKSLGLKGVNFFLVERGTPGLTVGKKIPKLGVRSMETTELSLDNCRIPKGNKLGEKGYEDLMDILAMIRTMTAALSLGLARAALDDGIKYAKERVCFAKPISQFQAIQHRIADAATELEAAKLFTYHCGRLIDDKIPCGTKAAMAKLTASEMACKVVDSVTRILAGYGFAMEYSAQRYFRDARFLLIGGGTSEILKNIIARDVIGA